MCSAVNRPAPPDAFALNSGQASQRQWRMRPAEPCTVTGLEYVISDEDGSTVAKLQLQLTQKENQQERTPLDGSVLILKP